jgi:phosphatidylserine decarboxylase
MNDKLFISALRLLPKNAWSRVIGSIAHARLPKLITKPSVRWFAKRYGIAIEDAELPLGEYRTVGHFFTRRLKPGARSIDRRPGFAVSPADGHVLNSGELDDGQLIQAKGRHFSVEALLKDPDKAKLFKGGSWATVYLSPRDYHRVHHPVEGTLAEAHYIPGYLWPVNKAAVENVDQLFCVNERVVTYVDSPLGLVATIMVGATSVGHISVAYDAELHSNKGCQPGVRHFDGSNRIARGDELGTFHLGSTAIVLFSDKGIQLEPLEDGQPIVLGQPIARLKSQSVKPG